MGGLGVGGADKAGSYLRVIESRLRGFQKRRFDATGLTFPTRFLLLKVQVVTSGFLAQMDAFFHVRVCLDCGSAG